MLREQQEVRPYIQYMADILIRKDREILENAYYNLKKWEFRDGVKPQGKQLEYVHQAATQFEQMVEDYLLDHIKVVRALSTRCDIAKNCLNHLQVYRKKGMIALLQTVYPKFGKETSLSYYDPVTNKIKRKDVPKGKGEAPDYYTGMGRRNVDWKWITFEGRVMKVAMSETRGTPLAPDVIRMYGPSSLDAEERRQREEYEDAKYLESLQKEKERQAEEARATIQKIRDLNSGGKIRTSSGSGRATIPTPPTNPDGYRRSAQVNVGGAGWESNIESMKVQYFDMSGNIVTDNRPATPEEAFARPETSSATRLEVGFEEDDNHDAIDGELEDDDDILLDGDGEPLKW